MAHDDEKPEAGDDPWAGLDADELPDLGGDFSFSFDAEPGDEPAADPDPIVPEETGEIAAEAEPAAAAGEAADVDDAAIDDWLSVAGDVAAAAAESSVLGGVASEQPTDELFASEGETLDYGASESSVEIGTGMSGIASPSGIEAFESSGDGEQDGADQVAIDESADPFAALAEQDPTAAVADEDAEAGAFSFMGATAETGADEAAQAGEDFLAAGVAAAGVAGAGAAAAAGGEAKQPAAKPKRPAPPKKKKPSMVGQLVGVIVGGGLAIPITLAILIWGFGKDPFGLTPMVPDSLGFLLPAKFRPGDLGSDAIDLAGAPSLDDLVDRGGAGDGGAGEAGLPSDADLAVDPEPEQQPEPEPMPDEPAPTDLAGIDTGLDNAAPADQDPLMDLLDESEESPSAPVEPVEPPPPPEPEPLDVHKLDTAIADVTAALEAVAALDDPSDPTRRRLLAKWYGTLAGYAEELAALEQVAAETGRPFEPVEERAATMRRSLADHPDLLDALAVLTRDWISYARRKSDGVVTPATFVSARRTGPWWRSQMTLPATAERPALDLVVLTRSEPAVAPGDTVVVTGLTVADDVIWAAEVQPAAADAFALPGL